MTGTCFTICNCVKEHINSKAVIHFVNTRNFPIWFTQTCTRMRKKFRLETKESNFLRIYAIILHVLLSLAITNITYSLVIGRNRAPSSSKMTYLTTSTIYLSITSLRSGNDNEALALNKLNLSK